MIKFSIPIYIFTGIAAISMACVAAFFSITGLAALYAGAAIPVIVMGTCIEFSKIVSTIWLHHFWRKSNFAMVGALLFMVVASMAVTSGGVYGFLTGSHANQEAPGQQKQMIVDRYDQQIKAEQEKVARDQDRLKSLDNIVSTSLGQGSRGGLSADKINRRQKTERADIQSDLDAAYKRIDDLSAQKLTITQSQAESEAKLGAVKYLASLFGADPSQAVMYFTLVMVTLLDPFAIILVIATQIAYEYHNKKKESLVDDGRSEIVISTIPDDVAEKLAKDEELPPLFPVKEAEPELEPERIEEPVDEFSTHDEAPEIENFAEQTKADAIIESADATDQIVEFFNDAEIQESINQAGDDTIVKIDEVVNSQHYSDNEKIKQVIHALESSLSSDRMTEVKHRWLD